MILQCPSCRTRFRVADEKIPPQGARIRCTRCATVFRTAGREKSPSPAGQPHARPPSPSFDPFADLPGNEQVPAPSRPAEEARRPPTPGPAPDFPDLDFDLPPPRARTPAPASASDLGSLLTKDDPFSDFNIPEPARRAAAPAPVPQAQPHPFAAHSQTDPFATHPDPFAAHTQTDPFAAKSRPDAFASPAEPDPFDAEDDFFGPTSPPPAAEPAAGAERPYPSEPTDPFSDIGLDLLAAPAGSAPASLARSPQPSAPADADEPTIAGNDETMPYQGTVDDLTKPKRIAPSPSARPLQSPGASVPAWAAPPPSQPPAARPVDPNALGPRLRRGAFSLLFNLVSAAVVLGAALLAIASLRSPRPLTFDDLGRPLIELALSRETAPKGADVEVSDVRTGIIETMGGTELFYVSGHTRNASGERLEGVHVSVELLRAGTVISHAESLAGLVPSPEDLYVLTSRANDELQQRLSRHDIQPRFEPGQREAFVAVFPLGAQDIQGTRVQVSARPGIPAALRRHFARPEAAIEPFAPAIDPVQ